MAKKNLQVVGHRGLPALYPENTIPSFLAAIDAGVDAVEFDVHMTSDRVPVVTHDETLGRCSNGSGKLRDFSFADLRQMDFGSWKGRQFAGLRIPTLDEALDAMCGRKADMHLLIEIKPDDTDLALNVLNNIRKRGITGNCLLLSFQRGVLHALRQAAPTLSLQGFPDRYVKDAQPGDYDIINKTCIWTSEVSAAEIGSFHARNIAVDVYPVDDEPALSKVLTLDVDPITTNSANTIIPMLEDKGYR